MPPRKNRRDRVAVRLRFSLEVDHKDVPPPTAQKKDNNLSFSYKRTESQKQVPVERVCHKEQVRDLDDWEETTAPESSCAKNEEILQQKRRRSTGKFFDERSYERQCWGVHKTVKLVSLADDSACSGSHDGFIFGKETHCTSAQQAARNDALTDDKNVKNEISEKIQNKQEWKTDYKNQENVNYDKENGDGNISRTDDLRAELQRASGRKYDGDWNTPRHHDSHYLKLIFQELSQEQKSSSLHSCEALVGTVHIIQGMIARHHEDRLATDKGFCPRMEKDGELIIALSNFKRFLSCNRTISKTYEELEASLEWIASSDRNFDIGTLEDSEKLYRSWYRKEIMERTVEQRREMANQIKPYQWCVFASPRDGGKEPVWIGRAIPKVGKTWRGRCILKNSAKSKKKKVGDIWLDPGCVAINIQWYERLSVEGMSGTDLCYEVSRVSTKPISQFDENLLLVGETFMTQVRGPKTFNPLGPMPTSDAESGLTNKIAKFHEWYNKELPRVYCLNRMVFDEST